jgi:hypothetical protein
VEYPIRADICSDAPSDPPPQQEAAELLPVAGSDPPQQEPIILIPGDSVLALAILP